MSGVGHCSLTGLRILSGLANPNQVSLNLMKSIHHVAHLHIQVHS